MKNEILKDVAKYLLEEGEKNQIFYFIGGKNISSQEVSLKLFNSVISDKFKSIERMESFTDRLISKNILAFKNNRPHDFVYYEKENNPIKNYINLLEISKDNKNYLNGFNASLKKSEKSEKIISNLRKSITR